MLVVNGSVIGKALGVPMTLGLALTVVALAATGVVARRAYRFDRAERARQSNRVDDAPALEQQPRPRAPWGGDPAGSREGGDTAPTEWGPGSAETGLALGCPSPVDSALVGSKPLFRRAPRLGLAREASCLGRPHEVAVPESCTDPRGERP